MSATASRSRGGSKTNSNGNGEASNPIAIQQEAFLETVEHRIEELEGAQEELERLRSIKAALTGRPSMTGGTASTRRRTQRRQGRQEEFMKLVREHPGITIAEAAKEMDIASNYLYRVTTKAINQGLLRKEGPNFFVVEESEKPAA